MPRILVIDDEPKILRLIGRALTDVGHQVTTCDNGEQAMRELSASGFDMMVSDVRLPDCSGEDLLEYAKSIDPELQVILITAYGTVSQAVNAMRKGASDYILKPFEIDALISIVAKNLENIRLRDDLMILKSERMDERAGRRITGNSEQIRHMKELINAVAALPTNVLVTGKSGTGKELVAETIHALGAGSQRPLLRVNCLAIPSDLMESQLFGHVRGAFTGAHTSKKGYFELASGGSLFLDEIGDLPMELQGKLLRVLEEGTITPVGSTTPVTVQTRVIATTNADLAEKCAAGKFREDLYFRLNVFPIHVPTLAERIEDIPELVRDLTESICKKLGRPVNDVSQDALDAMKAYPWPGNVRELRNVLERALILAGNRPLVANDFKCLLRTTTPHCCPCAAEREGTNFNERVDVFKKNMILDALAKANGVKKDAADSLGLSPRALSHHLKTLGIE